jgi:radical SAM protein with 4Fe4S-binding SPASM domain
METLKLNKISTRHYWEHFLLVPDNLLKPLFYPRNIATDEQKSLFKKFVCIVNIETSTYCNRKCSYCPVSLNDSRKNQVYMADELFNKILGELESIDYSSTIVFNLYNEPLADKNIYLKIKQVRKNLPHAFLMFNSNGDYVDSDSLNKLSEIGLNALFVTLHPPVNKPYQLDDRLKDFQKFFKKIGRNISQSEIKRFPEKKIPGSLPERLMSLSNHVEGKFLQLPSTSSGNGIIFSGNHLSNPSENGHIETNLDWHGMRLRIMANNWLTYGNSRAGTINFLNASTTRTLPCARPLRELTISYNGNVFPCCQFFPDSIENQKYIIDNLSSKSIFEIYASHTLAKWRKNLFTFGNKATPCDSCRDEDFSKQESWEIREAILKRLKI